MKREWNRVKEALEVWLFQTNLKQVVLNNRARKQPHA